MVKNGSNIEAWRGEIIIADSITAVGAAYYGADRLTAAYRNRYLQPGMRSGNLSTVDFDNGEQLARVYCAANPLRFIDPSGMAPIYSVEGEFLGADDEGLQGDYIIMKKENFYQNMSPEEAREYSIDRESLTDEQLKPIESHYETLPQRPDYDGHITLNEANKWYRDQSGESLFADIRKINLSHFTWPNSVEVGGNHGYNLQFNISAIQDGLVYGQITLKRLPNNNIRAFADTYDFDQKDATTFKELMRNIFTSLGEWVAGEGKAFKIYIYGTYEYKH